VVPPLSLPLAVLVMKEAVAVEAEWYQKSHHGYL